MKRCRNVSGWLRNLLRPTNPIQNKPRQPLRLSLETLEDRWLPSGMTFVVSNTNDNGPGSLRQAVLDSNGNATTAASPNTIDFDISDNDSVQVIHIGRNSGSGGTFLQALPALTQPVIVDGYSEPGSSPSSNSPGSNATILIELDGSNVKLAAPDTSNASMSGLDIEGGGSTVRGLSIVGFSGNGILLAGSGSDAVTGDCLGTDPTASVSGLGNGRNGAKITSADNTVGGTVSGASNVISGNANNGVEITGAGTSGNVVLGNLIGTNKNGTASIGNNDGVNIANGATANTVGGRTTGAANVISGNGYAGVYVTDRGTSGNVVLGNLIGTDKNGTARLGNRTGVLITGGAKANTVGGTKSDATNVISGSGLDGVVLVGPGTSGNLVLGNLIGTDINGTTSLGNAFDGVDIENGAAANTVGGRTTGAANVISGNSDTGVDFYGSGTSGNLVLGNLIGTDKSGTVSLGNLRGVDIGGTANTVGGATIGAANVISGNRFAGIDVGGTRNVVLGNLIGTDKNGTAILANNVGGVLIQGGATANTVGGSTSSAANVISGNGFYGVWLLDPGTSGNVVLGNLIGTDIHGTAALGNFAAGVEISYGPTVNRVGGTVSGSANVISGNGTYGVEIRGDGASANVVLGNKIGTGVLGVANIGNGTAGVLLDEGADGNIIGGTAPGSTNFIAFNVKGIVVGSSPSDTATIHESILGNSIFSNTSIGIDLGNDGPTPNGSNPRAFPNDGQNAPVITALSNFSASGNLSSSPRTTFRLEFFANPPSGGSQQGKVFLGFEDVTTGARRKVTFKTSFNTPIVSGEFVTATATNLKTGDTSEFSQTLLTTVITVTSNPTIYYSNSPQFLKLTASVFTDVTPILTGTVTFSIVGLPGSQTVSVSNNGLASATFVVPAATPARRYTIVAKFRGANPLANIIGYGALTVLEEGRGFGGA